ncbi:hypothetical protein C8R43DRAFT_941088 [Mycena crocata]|nr:hypothetical protein C8R43DRAFT_941088 [Mycena crocata]
MRQRPVFVALKTNVSCARSEQSKSISSFHLTHFGKAFDIRATTRSIRVQQIAKPDQAQYTAADAYFQAKSANILTASVLSRRSKVVFTNAYGTAESIPTFQALIGVLDAQDQQNTTDHEWKTLAQGAATPLTTRRWRPTVPTMRMPRSCGPLRKKLWGDLRLLLSEREAGRERP